MRRMITAIVGLWAAVLVIDARAEVTVMAVRLGASDVVAPLAKFYALEIMELPKTLTHLPH